MKSVFPEVLKRLAALSFFCSLLLASSQARAADIYLQLQRGQKVTIGLPDFNVKSSGDKDLARVLQDTTQNDILFTHLFNLQQEGPAAGGVKIDFEGWGKAGADILVTAVVDRDGEMARMIAAVYELPSGNPVFTKSYRTPPANAARMAHEFVSDLLFRFTGDRGVAQTKIAFANNASGSKEIYVIDYDGRNLRRITADKSLALLPRWAPDGKFILYTTYRRSNPDLYQFSFSEGRSRAFSAKRGLNSAACFAPDGKSVIATLSFQGAPNLYLMDLEGKVLRRLTHDEAADTSPSFSPDGRKIVFVSDRPGWPQIYLMDADGSHPARLSESGYCDSPSWSPRGDKIAYSRGTDRGHHQIVVRDVATGQEYQITQGMGNNENPSFSPDGRFLAFTSTRNGKRELFVSTLDGTVQRRLADIPGDCYTPAWGP